MSNELAWGLWEFDDEFVFARPRPLTLGAVDQPADFPEQFPGSATSAFWKGDIAAGCVD